MKSYESIIIFALALLGLFFLLRMVRNKVADLWHGLLCALAVAMMYLLLSFLPAAVRPYLSELPFVSFQGSQTVLFDFRGADSGAIYNQLLSMLALTFLVSPTAAFSRKGKSVPGRLIRRFLGLVTAFFVHWLICRFLVPFAAGFLPVGLVEKLPMILVIGLSITFLLGFLKLLIGLFLTVVNPVLGALFGFFFGHQLGRSLSRAIFATAALALLVLTVHQMGYSTLPISPLPFP